MSDKIRHVYEFEDFRLDAGSPGLWRDDALISISPKALETLILLVQKKGAIVSREELIETVWKDTFVEEGNINYTISLLRKIFENKELIKTVPRHGYRFTAKVTETSTNGTRSKLQIEPTRLEPAHNPRRFLWLIVTPAIIGTLILISFAVFWRSGKPAQASDLQPRPASEAMQSYLRGKMILDKRSVENREEKAIDEFQRAVTLDPTLAIAYAGLAEGFATQAVKIPYPQSRDTIAKAKTAADKALALEPNLAEGYLIRGWLNRNVDWNWPAAESDLRHAIELSPKNAVAHQRLAQTLSVTGKHNEALSEIQIAYDLDPISEIIIAARFPILEAMGNYDQALKESEAFLRENKSSNPAARAYATFLFHKQNFKEVIAIGEDSLANNPGKTPFAWLSLLAASYYREGNVGKSVDILEQLELLAQSDSKAQYSLAMNYAETGRHDDALAALEKCFDEHEERLIWIKNEPRFVTLRDKPRFQSILQKMNLV
ncbi:MAG: TPR end-of-group domain-containing protein [Pyrinomonadaceae bacterium]